LAAHHLKEHGPSQPDNMVGQYRDVQIHQQRNRVLVGNILEVPMNAAWARRSQEPSTSRQLQTILMLSDFMALFGIYNPGMVSSYISRSKMLQVQFW
jgi:hypothetical protein